jgi:lauroyl/myristoyl acyltransferase
VEVRGEEHLRTARDAGKPLMVAGVHTGNPELLGITLACLGMRPVGVAVRQPSDFRDRVITDIRLRAGGRLIRADRDAMRPALQVLRERAGEETLLFWMDEHVGGVVRGPSLGRGTVAPNGNIALAARLARMSGCVIVPGHVTRLPGAPRARFLTTFLPPVAMPAANGGNRAAETAAGAAAIDAAVDPVVRALLPQWLHVIAMRW